MITIRGTDCHGSGAYGASRGNRTHQGIDIVTHANESVVAYEGGTVTRLGYPYYSKKHPEKNIYRLVEITGGGYRLRYLYVGLLVELGDDIERGQTIGWSQDLSVIYPGIIQHLHFDVKDTKGVYINPVEYLRDLGYEVES